MPADYSSTARALALPISPPHSPNRQRPQSLWSRRSEQYVRPIAGGQGGTSFRNRTINNLGKMGRNMYKTAEKMTPVQMALAVLAGIALITLTIVFLVFNEKIFAWLEKIAQWLRETNGGWLILWAMTFATAFPPIIGYSTCLTLAGFVYGFPHGFVRCCPLGSDHLSDKYAGGLSLLPPQSLDRLAPSLSHALSFRDLLVV